VLVHTFGALREREFRLLWTSQLLSNAGSSLLLVALIFAVLDFGSARDLGLVLAALLVPNLVFLLVGGVWADRLPRQRVMLVADLVRGACQAIAAALLVGGEAQLWHLFVLAAGYGTATAFFNPAANGLVPETVPAARLQEANALMAISRRVTNVAGPAVSGVLVAVFGPGWVFAIDAVSFFVSALFLAAMRPSRREVVRERFAAALVRGWQEVRSRSWIWASILYFGVWNLAFAPFYVLGPVIAKRDLGGAEAWGSILTLTAVGYLAGGAIALRFRPERPLLVGYLLIAAYAAPLVLLAYPARAAFIGIASALGAATLEIANTLWFTQLQRRVPRDALSRVLSYESLGSLLFQPVGYLLAAPVAAAIGEQATLLGAAAVLWTAAVVVVMAVPGIRGLRDQAPEPVPARSGHPRPRAFGSAGGSPGRARRAPPP
jgi:MFS family permease